MNNNNIFCNHHIANFWTNYCAATIYLFVDFGSWLPSPLRVQNLLGAILVGDVSVTDKQ